MTLLLEAIWPGLAAAVVLGTLVGALSGVPRGRIGLATAGFLVAALAVLAALAVTGAAPGETGLWLEAGVAMLAVYLAGCVLGGLGRRIAIRG